MVLNTFDGNRWPKIKDRSLYIAYIMTQIKHKNIKVCE